MLVIMASSAAETHQDRTLRNLPPSLWMDQKPSINLCRQCSDRTLRDARGMLANRCVCVHARAPTPGKPPFKNQPGHMIFQGRRFPALKSRLSHATVHFSAAPSRLSDRPAALREHPAHHLPPVAKLRQAGEELTELFEAPSGPSSRPGASPGVRTASSLVRYGSVSPRGCAKASGPVLRLPPPMQVQHVLLWMQ